MATQNYGIDAPTVVRNFLVISALCLTASVVTTTLLASHVITGNGLTDILRINGLSIGTVCAVMACWMILSSKVLKFRIADRLLDARAWRGDEQVLDVGCGRGLVTIKAAQRVPDGKVTGVDIWQEHDLGGNSPEALLSNARAAEVVARVAVDTGDARSLPYQDGTFDVVTSMTAIHNIPDAQGRSQAIAECWRVVKPGGQILIFDIRHARHYARQLREAGAVDVRLAGPIFLWGPLGWRFCATKPSTTSGVTT